MKHTLAILLTLVFAVSALGACSINVNINQPTEDNSAAQTATEAAVTEAQSIGTLDDYVKTAKENTVTYGDGNTNTLRLPEILLDSADTKAANAEIESRFGSAVDSGDNYQGVYALDYEAYLNGNILSVVIISKYEGGNTYGLCYNFDVLTGKKLDNQQICEAANESLDEVIGDLREKTGEYYEEKFGAIPGNDAERNKTYSDDNLRQSSLYLDDEGDIAALVNVYAAIGGGQWVVQLDL